MTYTTLEAALAQQAEFNARRGAPHAHVIPCDGVWLVVRTWNRVVGLGA